MLLASMPASAADHAAWDALLRAHVEETGLVNYQELQTRQPELDAYLEGLAQADPTSLSREEQLAFWINAYNACVVDVTLDHYPIKSVKSVPGFFRTVQRRVAGQWLTLDEIEAKSHALGDWRSHMAVVCASAGCPSLRNEAYAPDRLAEQLADQTRRFLADPSRGFRVEGTTLWVSNDL